MSRAHAARWISRVAAMGMIVVALLLLKVVERQLRRLGELAERDETTRAAPAPEPSLPQPPSARLPRVLPPGERAVDAELDPEEGRDEPQPSDDALAEVPPVPGQVPEGAVW